MQKRKVLIVIHQLNYGGVQKSLIPALNAIDYSKNEVTLYIQKDRLDLLPQVNKNVSEIIINHDSTHYYRKPNALLLLLKSKIRSLLKMNTASLQSQLKNYVLKKQMDYECQHYFKDKHFDVAVSYIQSYTAQFVADYVQADKKVMFYHGSTDEEHYLHERIMVSFESIIGVSAGVVDVLKDLYPKYADKMDYIENYVDADEVRKRSEEYEIDVPDDKIKFCSCGRITKVKGFGLAVDAAKILKDKGIDFNWYFVGDGPERTNIENMISANGLQDCFVITGMQENPYPYMRCCDIYVQPSYQESFGLTIKEAMILNKPVVSTETIGGVLHIVNLENGILTDISAEAIANGIIKLLENRDLYDNIVTNLSEIDYSNEFIEYKNKWAKLLEV